MSNRPERLFAKQEHPVLRVIRYSVVGVFTALYAVWASLGLAFGVWAFGQILGPLSLVPVVLVTIVAIRKPSLIGRGLRGLAKGIGYLAFGLACFTAGLLLVTMPFLLPGLIASVVFPPLSGPLAFLGVVACVVFNVGQLSSLGIGSQDPMRIGADWWNRK